jgi:hypothetical protein
MKYKFVIVMILLALYSASCAAQDATSPPEEVTSVPTVAPEETTATGTAGEAEMTPTGAGEGATPAQATAENGLTPTADGNTSTQESGGAAGIPQTGPGDAGIPDNLQEAIRVLETAGATVAVGEAVQQDSVTANGRIVMINGEEVRFFSYPSAEELELEASQLAASTDPESEPRYYTMGSMLVFYGGRDPGVRDLLEDVLGAQEAGQ